MAALRAVGYSLPFLLVGTLLRRKRGRKILLTGALPRPARSGLERWEKPVRPAVAWQAALNLRDFRPLQQQAAAIGRRVQQTGMQGAKSLWKRGAQVMSPWWEARKV